MKKLFIAGHFYAQEYLLQEINKMQKALFHAKINWVPNENFHCTLKFLGNTPEEKIDDIKRAMIRAFSGVEKKEIQWNQLALFGSKYKPRVLWLGCKENTFLKDLHLCLKKELLLEGFEYDSQNFVPHVTLGRIKELNDKNSLNELIRHYDLIEFQKSILSELSLMESVLSSKGVLYNNLFTMSLS